MSRARPRPRWPAWMGVGLLTVTAVPGLVAGSARATAAACSDFSAVAAADGARVAVEAPGFLLVERADGGVPAAQASVDSLGTSSAFAAYPYPGDAALSVLSLAGAPRDDNPLVVESSYPASPERNVDAAAVSLAARSELRASNAAAQSGASAEDGTSSGLTRATADAACADSGEVTAVAESTAESLSFAKETLRIGRVRSVAKVVVLADGTRKDESHLEVTGVTVAGQTVAFTNEGLVTGTSASPLPDDPLAKLLADNGIDVSYVAARTQPDGQGVTAPAIRVQVTRDVPGVAKTVTTYTFGRAFATAGAAPTTVGDGPVTSVPPVSSGASGSGETTAAPAQSASPPRSPANDSVANETALLAGATNLFSSWSIYAVLVVGAAVLLSGGLLFKSLGVRLRWI